MAVQTSVKQLHEHSGAAGTALGRPQEVLRAGSRAGLRVLRATWEVLLPPNLNEEGLERAMANLLRSPLLPPAL